MRNIIRKHEKGLFLAIITLLLCLFVSYAMASEGSISLSRPTGLILDENFNLSWNSVENAAYYMLKVKFSTEDSVKIRNYSAIYSGDYIDVDGVSSVSLHEQIGSAYFSAGFNGQDVAISLSIQANPGYSSTYVAGEYSDFSNAISYSKTRTQLSTPSNVMLSDDLHISWDAVENVGYYMLKIKFTDLTGKEKTYGMAIYSGDFPIENGRSSSDISDKVGTAYFNSGFDDTPVSISVSLQANPGYSDIYVSGEYSDDSNSISYSNKHESLNTPSALHISTDLDLSWKSVNNAGYYRVKVLFIGTEKQTFYSSLTLYSGDFTDEEGKSTANIKEMLGTAYFSSGFNGEDVLMAISIQANPGYSSKYIPGEYSEYSNYLVYNNAIARQMKDTYSCLQIPAQTHSIEAYAFEGTSSEMIVIPSSCQRVGAYAFSNCPNLLYVIVDSTTEIDSSAFDGSNPYIILQ